MVNKPERIKIIPLKRQPFLLDAIQNPILLEFDSNKELNNEKELELLILAQLKNFFFQLGEGFTFVGNQYKVNYCNKIYFIDILLFNYKLNSFVVIELKLRELEKEDKAQIELYMQLVDKQVKERFHNKTIGVIISKEQNKFIANFVGSETIIPITYKIGS